MKQYSTNLAKGKEIIEYYINELINQGVTNIPIWSEPLGSINPSQDASSASTLAPVAAATTMSTTEDPSLIAARRRLSTQDASAIFTSSSPPKAAAMAMTTASNFSALSDELESFQIDEYTHDRQGRCLLIDAICDLAVFPSSGQHRRWIYSSLRRSTGSVRRELSCSTSTMGRWNSQRQSQCH